MIDKDRVLLDLYIRANNLAPTGVDRMYYSEKDEDFYAAIVLNPFKHMGFVFPSYLTLAHTKWVKISQKLVKGQIILIFRLMAVK